MIFYTKMKMWVIKDIFYKSSYPSAQQCWRTTYTNLTDNRQAENENSMADGTPDTYLPHTSLYRRESQHTRQCA